MIDVEELENLTGAHVLDTAAIQNAIGNTNTFSFGMDGKVYTAIEDKNDGYRSVLDSIAVSEDFSLLQGSSPVNREIVIMKQPHSHVNDDEILMFIDVLTGHIWLRLGTDYSDSYYPYCIFEWNAMPPENEV